MAKFYGTIGYAESVETEPGVWEDHISECQYYCELNRITRRTQSSQNLNDDINISNELSIVADPYANKNFHLIRYVVFGGTRWKVSNVDASLYPRLTLTLGGVYNG